MSSNSSKFGRIFKSLINTPPQCCIVGASVSQGERHRLRREYRRAYGVSVPVVSGSTAAKRFAAA